MNKSDESSEETDQHGDESGNSSSGSDDDSLSSRSSTSDSISYDAHGSVLAGDELGNRETRNEIAADETEAVFCTRFVLFVVLLVVGFSLASFVHTYISGGEKREFREAIDQNADVVFEEIGNLLAHILGGVDAFAFNMVSHARSTNQEWPFVVLPDFAEHAAKLLSLSPVFAMTTYPVVYQADFEQWAVFSASNDSWVDEGIEFQNSNPNFGGKFVGNWSAFPTIHSNEGAVDPNLNPGPYFPAWQSSPVVPLWSAYSWDLYPPYEQEVIEVFANERVAISKAENIPEKSEGASSWAQGFLSEDIDASEPYSAFFYPIIDEKQNASSKGDKYDTDVVGIIGLSILWRSLVEKIALRDSNGVLIVLGNECDQQFSFQIDGANITYLGSGDHHELQYSADVRRSYFQSFGQFSSSASTYTGANISDEFCKHYVEVYPSATMEDDFITSKAAIFTAGVIMLFCFTSAVFVAYDIQVEKRQEIVLRSANQSSAIVSSLFPSAVRARLYEESGNAVSSKKQSLKSFLLNGNETPGNQEDEVDGKYAYGTKPIADLFPETSIYFADLVGFTAWSSTREPHQVFQLLERIFKEFDDIAKKRRIFKVETVGDCYVAVTGLPDPRPNHAVAMVRFAMECSSQFELILPELEILLGPDTGDLAIRAGIHSGPVTAGVLRGERSRFQLFGDTMNTASRMESTGVPRKIQISEETARQLSEAGKGDWLQPREERVVVKGKGSMQTYMVKSRERSITSNEEGRDRENVTDEKKQKDRDAKTERLVQWNTDVLLRILEKIRARSAPDNAQNAVVHVVDDEFKKVPILSEVSEIIALPKFDGTTPSPKTKGVLSEEVQEQLEHYVAEIASLYHDMPFHNYEHASHVTLSVSKLMARINAPDLDVHVGATDSVLHDHTYGITSDPLTQFACAFSALIHDVGHTGVPNARLAAENPEMAAFYDNKSTAEQNSVNVAWQLLMRPQFSALRAAIYSTKSEKARFRQLVVNSVMATDIMDPDLKKLRNKRWTLAFSETANEADSQVDTNRKATIVIDLIQASDVAHTMQHWHIFRKWNERLFLEMYKAFKEGRAEKDPSEFWYSSEIGFFDFYIIPLAMKLKDCGVFGVSSDEYLNYAQRNREEWELKGMEVVETMIEKAKSLGFGEASKKQLNSAPNPMSELGVEVSL